jgi:hypothetical protein
MELHEALSQISEIRRQMARTAVFRGYRSATAAFSGVVALATAAAQAVFLEDPKRNVSGYLVFWLVAARTLALLELRGGNALIAINVSRLHTHKDAERCGQVGLTSLV